MNSTIRVTTPATLGAGLYNITCNITERITSPAQAIGELRIIDMRNISVARISPRITKRMDADTLTIYGTGFVQTSELQCFYGNLKTPLVTTFVNSTEIRCALTKELVMKPRSSDVYLSFAVYQRAEKAKELALKHHIGLLLPEVVSAKFSSKLDRVIITFNEIVNQRDENVTLADLFPSNYSDFGSKAYYEFSSKRLIVFMLGSPTIVLGNLTLNLQKVKSQADKTIYPDIEMTQIALETPEDVVMPQVQIMGPSSVGK